MKKINWNLGLLIIKLGYSIRKHNYYSKPKFSLRWYIGVEILKFGYWLRGDVPQKCWGLIKLVIEKGL